MELDSQWLDSTMPSHEIKRGKFFDHGDQGVVDLPRNQNLIFNTNQNSKYDKKKIRHQWP
jgi:hypothetical protein